MNMLQWILIAIEIDRGEITMTDPKQYPTSMYPKLVDALGLVWACFVKKYLRQFKEDFYLRDNFHVCIYFHSIFAIDNKNFVIQRNCFNLFFHILCLRQEYGNNLFGFHICDFIHNFIVDPKKSMIKNWYL
jgi:hypothetical protein